MDAPFAQKHFSVAPCQSQTGVSRISELGEPHKLRCKTRRSVKRRHLGVSRNVHVSENGPTGIDEPSVVQLNRVELPGLVTEPDVADPQQGGGYYPKDSVEAQRVFEQGVLQGDLLNAGVNAEPVLNDLSTAGTVQEQANSPTAAGSKSVIGGNNLREVLCLALPALGAVLADPLMSLVDTACVGQLSSVELGALGPNTAVFNFVFQVFTFLGVSTTNAVARNSITLPGLSPVERTKRRKLSEDILCYSMTAAATIGTVTAAFLITAGPYVLRAMGTGPEILPFALPYLRIRALASPAVMIMTVSQGACLGQQDMWTPLRVVAVAGLVNLFGDLHLILNLKMGTVGAAVATTAAQYAGAIFFLWYLRRGGQNGTGLKLRWAGLPKLSTLEPMLELARVLVVRTGVGMMVYTVATATAASLGTIAIAGHQVMLQTFWLLSYFPEPFSLTAQSLIARDKSNPSRVRAMSHLLLKLGSYTGGALALVLGGLLCGLPRMFSSDPAVISAFQSLVPQAMTSLFVVSVAMMCEGVSIGTDNIEHLPHVLSSSVLITLCWFYASGKAGLGLGSIWWGMVLFFVSRSILHVVYIRNHWETSPFGLYKKQVEPATLEPQLA